MFFSIRAGPSGLSGLSGSSERTSLSGGWCVGVDVSLGLGLGWVDDRVRGVYVWSGWRLVCGGGCVIRVRVRVGG